MQRSTIRLSRPLQAAVYVTFGALLLTGVGWMLAQNHLDEEVWEKIPRWLLKIHGGAAMAALLVLGALTLHVKRGWKAGKNRLSGALLIALNAFLIVTGYGLYYAGGEEMRAWLSRWHTWIGVGTFVLLPAHVVAGRLIIRRLHRRKAGTEHASRVASGRRHLP
ncbi:MAG: hypothetical protein ABI680_02100 [Chthoniobacteraceae bacterium]